VRWLILAVIASLAFTAWVGVSAVTSGPEGDPEVAEPHKPDTDQERLVARVATKHVRRLIRARSLSADGQVELESVGLRDEASASATFTGLLPGPAVTVWLVREGDRWRAIRHDSYATA
jgi:hypothetical protein